MTAPTTRRALAYGFPILIGLVYIVALMGMGQESNNVSNFAADLISGPGILLLMAFMFMASWLGVLDRIHTNHRGTSFAVSGVLILLVILAMTSRNTEFMDLLAPSMWFLVGAGIIGSIVGMIHARKTRPSQRPAE